MPWLPSVKAAEEVVWVFGSHTFNELSYFQPHYLTPPSFYTHHFLAQSFSGILQDRFAPFLGIAPFLYTPKLIFLHPASSLLTLPFTFCHLKICRNLFLRYISCCWFIPLYSFTFCFIGVSGGRNHEWEWSVHHFDPKILYNFWIMTYIRSPLFIESYKII